MQKKEILELFNLLHEKLERKGIVAEIGVVGGSAICLAFDDRRSTKDVDAIFAPASELRTIALEIADEKNLPTDWLNDGVKGFLSEREPDKTNVLNLPNLRVWIPEANYLLAMKALSARFDTMDKDDLILLIKHLGIKTADEVISVVKAYYPHQKIHIKTQYFLEELFQSIP